VEQAFKMQARRLRQDPVKDPISKDIPYPNSCSMAGMKKTLGIVENGLPRPAAMKKCR